MTADFSFLNLTARKDVQGASQTTNANQTQKNQNANNDKDALKTTDVFTAAKNGMQAQNQTKGVLAGGDSGFEGTNLFGDSGFGDTVSFSTKNNDKQSTSSAGFTGKTNTSVSFANNDSELKEIAETLGCEADEDTIKNKLQSMSPEELVKLDGDTLDTAADLGLINMSDVEKKIGSEGNNNEKKDDDQNKKLEFGTFTSGSEV